MKTDRDFLAWIHERLQYVHHEHPNADYMHRLRAIVLATPPRQNTVPVGGGKDTCDLYVLMSATPSP